MTNYEQLKTLPLNELAQVVTRKCNMCNKCCSDYAKCTDGITEWLNSEYIPECKPCPLCGGKMIGEYNHGNYLVCKSCGLYFGVDTISAGERELAGAYAKKAELIDDWNNKVKEH